MFKEKSFTFKDLSGISAKNIEEHLKLYSGYVKNANTILAHMDELAKDGEKYAYEISELQRRFSFEFDGMRNHEYFFASLVDGHHPLREESALKSKIEEQWGSFDSWLSRFKTLAMTRGVGWAVLYFDTHTGNLVHAWVEEQHLGHLTGLTPILMLDMWEHAYVYDFPTSEKKKYIEAFFENLNWEEIEKNFANTK
ncbi:MAG: superoxide dismutase, Fe-Mn family [Patescibacteria group bacterium]|jgi:Fe-Mn family superoxide dismutase|nr:superoxide dismutase, Fe-Mn family [Patescibacteria group bacterium]